MDRYDRDRQSWKDSRGENKSDSTFIQPVAQTIEHHALLPGGYQTDGPAVNRRLIVNVVLKDENLCGEMARYSS